jgi:hypothetical protein
MMRRFFVLACVAAGPASVLAAQSPDQPSVVLSIFAGVQTGSALWSVGRQPLCVLDPQNQCTANYDTLQLSRRTGSTLTAGVAGLYFPRPHVGLHAQLAYQGFPLDDGCTGLHFGATDPDQRNEQICTSINRSGIPGGSMSALVGVVLRAGIHAVSPYLRIGGGVVTRPQSSLDMVGEFSTGTNSVGRRTVIFDESPHRTWVGLYLAAGLTAPLSPGYQIRLELHDLVSSVERPTGPADDAASVETSSRTIHSFALTVGLDIVLERKRGRRY